MKYKSEIDGLRAIAILLVLIYHMFPSFLPGGFIGVDVFFIISGYLIGSTIFKEYENGNFSFLKFYQRRLIRIIPLLLIVVIATWIAGYFLLLPEEFKSLGRHVGAATTFSSNFLLLKEVDYFNPAAELKPLLHLWSLGIEEQFYLVLPLVIVFLGRKPKKNIIGLTLLIFFSFIISNYYLLDNLEKAFFRPESRFWELLLGVLFSKVEGNNLFRKLKGKNYLSILALVILLVCSFLYSGKTPFPGIFAILPVVGALLIIAVGNNGFVNKNILSSRPFLFVGKISYSLYLWHWVLLSFSQIIYQQNVPVYTTLTLGIISIVLSCITFYLVESPLKKLSPISKKIITITSIVGLVSIYFIGRFTYKAKIIQSNLPPEVLKISEAVNDYKTIRDLRTSNEFEIVDLDDELKFYKRGKGSKKIALVGDSHSEQYLPHFLSKIAKDDQKITLYLIVRPGCAYLSDLKYTNPQHDKVCNKYVSEGINFLIKEKVEMVIFSSNYVGTFEGRTDTVYEINGTNQALFESDVAYEKGLQNLKSIFHQLKEAGINTYFIPAFPTGEKFNPTAMLKRKVAIPPYSINIINPSLEEVLNGKKKFIDKASEIAKEENVFVINAFESLCSNDECRVTYEDGTPYYRDSNHFTIRYVKERVKYLDFVFNIGASRL